MIAPDDRGFTLGHGLFETVLFLKGEPVDWEAHMGRLERGCPVLGLPRPEPGACRRAAEQALTAAGGPARAAVRVNWSAGPGGRGLDPPDRLAPRLTAHASAVAAPERPVSLATVSVRRNEHSPASRLKTLAYLDNVLARAEARRAGAEEALMLNTAGRLACAAVANLFWVEGESLRTPALACGVLGGIMRARVLAACRALGLPAVEVEAAPAEMRGRPAFITNSLVGVRRVDRLDGEALPDSPIVAALARAVEPFAPDAE